MLMNTIHSLILLCMNYLPLVHYSSGEHMAFTNNLLLTWVIAIVFTSTHVLLHCLGVVGVPWSISMYSLAEHGFMSLDNSSLLCLRCYILRTRSDSVTDPTAFYTFYVLFTIRSSLVRYQRFALLMLLRRNIRHMMLKLLLMNSFLAG